MYNCNSNQEHSVIATISKQQAFGVLSILPYDIIAMVFTFLNKNDCLKCMALNREWHNLVPDCSKNVWQNVVLSGRDSRMKHYYRRVKCLGRHVRSVRLDMTHDKQQENLLYDMFKKLLRWGCNEIEFLEIICASQTFVQPNIIHLLQQLSSSLKHLTLKQHRSNISIQNVLAACPKLTHFTYKPKPLDWYRQYTIYGQEPSLTATDDNSDNYSNDDGSKSNNIFLSSLPTMHYDSLIYLCIDTCISYQARLAPVLQKCPNLECFLGLSLSNTSFYTQNYISSNDNVATIDLDKVSLWCPKLRYFMGNKTYYDLPDVIIQKFQCQQSNKMTNSITDNSEKQPSYYFSICENHGPEKIVQHLAKNQHRLGYLKLVRQGHFDNIYTWSNVFRSLQTPHLHTLIFDSIDFDADALLTLLSSCLTIDTLVLSKILSALDFSNTLIQHRSLSLRRLEIDQSSILDQHAAMTMIERFPRLETLIAVSTSLMLSHAGAFQNLKHLKYLHIDGAYYWEQSIDHEQDNIRLSMRSQAPVIEPTLFHQLAVHGTCLETIKIRAVENVDFKLLLAVAHIPTIKNLDIELDQEGSSSLFCSSIGTMKRQHPYNNNNIHDNSINDDDDLFTLFARKLFSNAIGIEILKLEGVLYIPSGVLSILGLLPKLNTLSITTIRRGSLCQSAFAKFVVEPREIISLLCSSGSLNELCLDGSGTKKDNPRGYNIVRAMMKEKGILASYSFQNLPRYVNFDDWCLETYTIGRHV